MTTQEYFNLWQNKTIKYRDLSGLVVGYRRPFLIVALKTGNVGWRLGNYHITIDDRKNRLGYSYINPELIKYFKFGRYVKIK